MAATAYPRRTERETGVEQKEQALSQGLAFIDSRNSEQ